MFSATLHSPDILELSGKICENPIWVDLKARTRGRSLSLVTAPCDAFSFLPRQLRVLILGFPLGLSLLSPRLCLSQGKDSVPEGVRHAFVVVDPSARPDWATLQPAAPTDRCHALDRNNNSLVRGPKKGINLQTSPVPPAQRRRGRIATSLAHRTADPCLARARARLRNRSSQATDEAKSEAVKRLKPHVLKEVIDKFKMEQALIFCRTNFDCDNLEAFLTAVGGGRREEWRRLNLQLAACRLPPALA